MAVKDIEYYRQQNGRDILKVITKPTKSHPDGYFYVDRYFEDLIKIHSWVIISKKKNVYVVAGGKAVRFLLHQEIANKCLGHYPVCIDHENGLGIDNICDNLTEATQTINMRNIQKQGYQIGRPWKLGGSCFRPHVWLDESHIWEKAVRKEDEACLNQFQLEAEYYSDYNYDFLKDRRNDLDILDLERTGKISAEEATFRHVMRYAKDNAWYIFRYNLEDYFKAYNVALPAYSLNIEGRMVHPVTGQILCPFG